MTQDIENGSERGGHEPRFTRRAIASRANGKLGGHQKGFGRKRVDWAKWNQLATGGAWEKDIARHLGISRRTLQRRKTERQRQEFPM